ncbi:phytanoyl- dioxygenase protein [Pochonia chlamydosporia 170]|uniref:Phytanoyl- dioxygenase protein n=1 Tax=Pochonia chlamydosporia 170 TaxID=1380566 RepID=A0A179F0W4_METCM|nr:phytanoyl- dioxygenase protein [Pochonia chlamydosporia 170]OAQ59107.1 phytanoyl- dioxygenase protein [Pochonia chlamydosporia 170]
MVTNTSITPTQLRHVNVSSSCTDVLKVLREDGGVIIKGLLSQDQVDRMNQDIQPAMDQLAAGSTHSDEWTQQFHGTNTKRLTNLVTISQTFRQDILDNDIIHHLCEAVFLQDSGTYWLNTAQVIEIGPGNKAQELHRDQVQYPIFTHCGPDAPEACVNFMIALTDFTQENGATRVIPGSHRWPDLKNNGSPDDTVPAIMAPGDACFINGKVVHGGGANRTQDFKRRGIALSFQCSYLTPEEAYPFIVEKALAEQLSERGQRMIAFRSQFPKDSPGLWQSNYGEIANVIGI